MNAEKKSKVKRIGRYWVDRELLDEGYDLEDIVDTQNVVIELPEIFDPAKRRNIRWLVCPDCGEKSQVDRHSIACPHCEWEQGAEPERWAA